MSGFPALLRAEIVRVLSRRMVRWFGLGLLVVLAITIVVVWTNPPEQRGGAVLDPVTQRFIITGHGFILDTGLVESFIYGFVPSLLGAALLVGSSLVGAEWGTRGLTNLLVWEPRRRRVLGAKLAAAGVVIGAATVTYLFVLTTLLMLAAASVGQIADLDLASVLLAILRAGVFTVVIAALGATTAAVMRSTVASFVIAFLLLVVVQPILLNWSDDLARWLFTTNAIAFLTWEAQSFGGFTQASSWQAGAVLIGYAAAFTGIATWVFRRQEIG